MKFYKQAYTVVGTVILIIGLCLIPSLHYLINDYDSLEALGINAVLIFVLYLLQSVSSYLFFAYRSAVIKADQKQYILNIAEYGITILTNIFQVVILLIWHDFVVYTASVIVFNILKNVVNAIIAQHLYPEAFIKDEDSISKEEVKGLFKDCGALFIYKANGVVLKATDNMVLSSFIGLEIVGMYSNYLLIYSSIKSFLNRFYSATKASMGNLYAEADVEKQYGFFQVMNFITIIFYGTAAVGVAVVADELINWWIGETYVIKQPFAILVGIEILFLGLKNNLGQVRNISGAFRQAWFRPVMGIIINLGVSIAMVKRYGIYGVIIGTITADLLTNFMVDPAIIHKYSFKNYKPVSEYYKKNVAYIAILVVIGTLDMFLCSVILPNHGIVSITLHVIICGVSVPSVFVLIYHKTPECRYLIKKSMGILKKMKKA
jgi:O-antigen/teichoic acid export membrane protein